MNEAIKDCVGVGWVADDVVPSVDGRLRGEHPSNGPRKLGLTRYSLYRQTTDVRLLSTRRSAQVVFVRSAALKVALGNLALPFRVDAELARAVIEPNRAERICRQRAVFAQGPQCLFEQG